MANKACCAFRPTIKGQDVESWNDYLRVFGNYYVARDVFNHTFNNNFLDDHPKINVDKQGVPLVSDLLREPDVIDFLLSLHNGDAINDNDGQEWVRDILGRDLNAPIYDAMPTNVSKLIDKAKKYNQKSRQWTAVLDTVKGDNSKITLSVLPRSSQSDNIFQRQYKASLLTEGLMKIFSPLGIHVNMLETNDDHGNIDAFIDFSHANELANGFDGLIRVAHNLQGALAAGHELTHLLFRLGEKSIFHGRLLSSVASESIQREIIGEDRYDQYEANGTAQEEAATIVLQEALSRKLSKTSDSYPLTIAQRLKNDILKLFVRFSPDVISDLLVSVNTKADILVNDLLKQREEDDSHLALRGSITEEDIKNLHKSEKLYQLAKDYYDKAKEIINTQSQKEQNYLKALKTHKRTREIIYTLHKNAFNTTSSVSGTTQNDELITLLDYLSSVSSILVENIDNLKFYKSHNHYKLTRADYNLIYDIWKTFKFYSPFISDISAIISDPSFISSQPQLYKYYKEICDICNTQNRILEASFKPLLVPILTTAFNDYIDISKDKIENIVKYGIGDIWYVDMFLKTLASSNDDYLKIVNNIIMYAKKTAQNKTITFAQDKVQPLYIWAKNHGIMNFEFMYAHYDKSIMPGKSEVYRRTGSYVSELDWAGYWKAFKDYENKLEEQYANAPNSQRVIDKQIRIWKKSNWDYKNNCPLYSKWKSKEWIALTNDQKSFVQQLLQLKEELDDIYPAGATDARWAIQKKRDNAQLLFDIGKDPVNGVLQLGHIIKDSINLHGDETLSYKPKDVITGEQLYTIPIYWQRPIDPEKLTLDPFGALIAYSYSAYNYGSMSDIEGIVTLSNIQLKEYRVTLSGKRVKSYDDILGKSAAEIDDIEKEDGNRIKSKLRAYIEKNIYGYERVQSFPNKILDRIVDRALSIGGLSALGFNFLANTANLITGVGQVIVESAGREFINPVDLAWAMKEFAVLLPEQIKAGLDTFQNSKLHTLADFFNMESDFARQTKKTYTANILHKFLNTDLSYVGQTIGDRYLYSLVMLARLHNIKVKDNLGNISSLYDALHVEKNKAGIARITYDPKLRDENGILIDENYFTEQSEKLKHINASLFGVYNVEDGVVAERFSYLRPFLQFRKWIVPAFTWRYSTSSKNPGFYVRFIMDMYKLYKGIYDQTEKQNVKKEVKHDVSKIIADYATWALCIILKNILLSDDDDDDDAWIHSFLTYVATRESHEFGQLVASPSLVIETLTTVTSPGNLFSQVKNLCYLIQSASTYPFGGSGSEIMQSGQYENKSRLYRDFMRAPIPLVSHYRQLNRIADHLDDQIEYYETRK